jgi:hypothetical protein
MSTNVAEESADIGWTAQAHQSRDAKQDAVT